ncbi:connective tissue growth factor-like [Limulus polyphemus]|uniref:Connective tissue growth factor-like n=1 Tax=Limulus polyphemus TaxID=6850 RepID=A0ABM1TND9_LIMPO|nr:connective tissue growth factor-like [Limulus polyphemus]
MNVHWVQLVRRWTEMVTERSHEQQALLKVTKAVTLGFLVITMFNDAQSQHGPCFGCEEYRQTHPNSHPYEKVRGRCSYPCHCPSGNPICPEGVAIVTDGCGCCPVCARQQGDVCDKVNVCDDNRNLKCFYQAPLDTTGICNARKEIGCQVGGVSYADGETFKLDCKTKCTCQNGSYGCVSLCPHENIRPSPKCRNPQLVRITGACCKEWLCEPNEEKIGGCIRHFSPWSTCSVTCGVGISYRMTNDNNDCLPRRDTRLCQLRPCETVPMETGESTAIRHGRMRRHRHCRSTVKSSFPAKLTDDGNCTSVRAYRSTFCGMCSGYQCCQPQLSTTVKVPFRCGHPDGETENIVSKNVMFTVKCVCTDHC